VVLRTCKASLILYNQKVISEFGSANAVVTKLHNSARDAGITNVKFPNISRESLLDILSDIIERDYHAQHPEIAHATPDLAEMTTVINQQSHSLSQIISMLSNMTREQEMERQHIVSQESMMSDLYDKVASQQSTMSDLYDKAASLET
jgi:hypothetical protein